MDQINYFDERAQKALMRATAARGLLIDEPGRRAAAHALLNQIVKLSGTGGWTFTRDGELVEVTPPVGDKRSAFVIPDIVGGCVVAEARERGTGKWYPVGLSYNDVTHSFDAPGFGETGTTAVFEVITVMINKALPKIEKPTDAE